MLDTFRQPIRNFYFELCETVTYKFLEDLNGGVLNIRIPKARSTLRKIEIN
jgi:hypothetical protein